MIHSMSKLISCLTMLWLAKSLSAVVGDYKKDTANKLAVFLANWFLRYSNSLYSYFKAC